ncbi:hypothetical protein E0W68_08855 [Flavobacterium salilacus subsp. salilacus]|uniref:restriction endonuclease n=1 Tax=Flavobacterium TaxID=237 RepID=UPI0010753B6D|nr:MULTISPECIES: restriction endonuclease [Flavobacterium]KAF2518427.1 hypothetical protein E0W68_08855 [Flavobacterium salilacus subsp. salilacus]MBE1615063.1 restriction endonuclease [Flavobacterium sp. SaA2.13]
MNNNIWLHRISHHAPVSYPLLDKNYITIGFSDFIYDDFITKVLSAGEGWKPKWDVLDAAFEEQWGTKPRIRHNLWRFIEGFKKGDWVVVPKTGTFSVYEIIDDLPDYITKIDSKDIIDWDGNRHYFKNERLYNESHVFIDLGFFRRVKPLELNVSRYDFADSQLTSRLKFRSTNANITDLKDNVIKAVGAYRLNKPISIHSNVKETFANSFLDILKQELNPDKFELLVKWYFERIGASEAYIPPKNSVDKTGDVDVIAVFELLKVIICCQVKFHEGKTDDWAVSQILDYQSKSQEKNMEEESSLDDDYSRVNWVISTSETFSEKAVNAAKEEKVQLFNGKRFVEMLIDAGILSLDKAFN